MNPRSHSAGRVECHDPPADLRERRRRALVARRVRCLGRRTALRLHLQSAGPVMARRVAQSHRRGHPRVAALRVGAAWAPLPLGRPGLPGPALGPDDGNAGGPPSVLGHGAGSRRDGGRLRALIAQRGTFGAGNGRTAAIRRRRTARGRSGFNLGWGSTEPPQYCGGLRKRAPLTDTIVTISERRGSHFWQGLCTSDFVPLLHPNPKGLRRLHPTPHTLHCPSHATFHMHSLSVPLAHTVPHAPPFLPRPRSCPPEVR